MPTRELEAGLATPAPEQLEAEIARARERVASSASALQRQLAQATDWRAWVRSEPTVALVLAFGVGFLLGKRSK